eukprot:Gb_10885 [translate_table: standard]
MPNGFDAADWVMLRNLHKIIDLIWRIPPQRASNRTFVAEVPPQGTPSPQRASDCVHRKDQYLVRAMVVKIIMDQIRCRGGLWGPVGRAKCAPQIRNKRRKQKIQIGAPRIELRRDLLRCWGECWFPVFEWSQCQKQQQAKMDSMMVDGR